MLLEGKMQRIQALNAYLEAEISHFLIFKLIG